MKNINTLVAAVAALGLVSVATFTYAADTTQCGPAGHHQPRNGNHFPFKGKLDLSVEQKQTLSAARKAQEPAMQDLHERMRVAHNALEQAGETNADDTTLTNLSNTLAALMAQQEVARVKAQREFLSILTPEQKQKLETWKAEHKDHNHWQNASSAAAK